MHQERDLFFCVTESDEGIPSIDTPTVPTAEHIQGPITRACAKQLNYQVLSFLGTFSYIHENMMLPKSDVFVTLSNDKPSMDERDKHWSMNMHGDGSQRERIEEDVASENFRTLKPPDKGTATKVHYLSTPRARSGSCVIRVRLK
jgi:hypothetical protein